MAAVAEAVEGEAESESGPVGAVERVSVDRESTGGVTGPAAAGAAAAMASETCPDASPGGAAARSGVAEDRPLYGGGLAGQPRSSGGLRGGRGRAGAEPVPGAGAGMDAHADPAGGGGIPGQWVGASVP